jgi:FMN phosphatase YigB (HAD superfamily)
MHREVDTILFDLGNTLVRYYDMPQFRGILEQAIARANGYLLGRGAALDTWDDIWTRTLAENFESQDFTVRPLEGRLRRIFGTGISPDNEMEMCRRFMAPIFALAAVYDDVVPTLDALKGRGLRMAIISNTPWGSPASLWLEEIERLGLTGYVERSFFCRDCGWRKPARQIFEHVFDAMQIDRQQCILIGDDPRWDKAGAEAAGIPWLLIDRDGEDDAHTMTSLLHLSERLRVEMQNRR